MLRSRQAVAVAIVASCSLAQAQVPKGAEPATVQANAAGEDVAIRQPAGFRRRHARLRRVRARRIGIRRGSAPGQAEGIASACYLCSICQDPSQSAAGGLAARWAMRASIAREGPSPGKIPALH